jgi:predicted RNA-binding protein with TRAM domain
MGFGERRGSYGGGSGGNGGGGGRRRFEPRNDEPQREPPVHGGEEYDVEITDVAAKGDGICKIEGFIIFVAGAQKGERCRIKIREVRRRFAIADRAGEAAASAPAETEAATEEAEESEEQQ